MVLCKFHNHIAPTKRVYVSETALLGRIDLY